MINKFRAWDGERMIAPYEVDEYPILTLTTNYWASVMPYINVNDIDGQEIYLNDIIELDHGHRGVVKFENGYFYHTAKTEIMGMTYWNKKIGNIFENPELLYNEEN